MRILIAPDKFKGSLSAQEAATAIAEGWRAGSPANLDLEFSCRPVADGGEGTAKVIYEALGGSWVSITIRDPLGRPLWGGLSPGTFFERSQRLKRGIYLRTCNSALESSRRPE
jgi:glycerate 2-kinase